MERGKGSMFAPVQSRQFVIIMNDEPSRVTRKYLVIRAPLGLFTATGNSCEEDDAAS